MFRRCVFLLLIGMGMGLPWFVQDWLANSDRDPAAARSWFEQVRDGIGVPAGSGAPVSLAGTVETAERDPYPLASKTRRIVGGFFGGTGTGLTRGVGGLLPSTEPSSTPRSRALVDAAVARLAPELGKLGLAAGDPVVLRLFKEENELEIWMKPSHEPLFTLFKVHRLSISAGRPGPKLREGDGQAPEGFYEIRAGGLRPETRHHLGLDLGYPNRLDQSLGRGGSDIMIHGGEGSAGGFGLAPAVMDEVYALIDAALREGEPSVPVHLFPFRLTDRRMDEVVEGRSRWTEEWVNLKEGYDFFETVRLAPAIGTERGRYDFRIAGIEN
jgi:murein L,D-transpeptidase YafK